MLDVLHVAAMPFPSAQGTQAAVAAMVRAAARAGERVALLTYAHGAAGVETDLGGARHWRIPAVLGGPRSLRSGPSSGKLVADLLLVGHLGRFVARHRPARIVAHHVEAAAAALLLPRRSRPPVTFVAHTSLGDELPVYLPSGLRARPGPGALLGRAGRALDAALIARADEVHAVSPALAGSLPGDRARWRPIPWPLDDPVRRPTRAAARAALGLPADRRLVLYAGNLDRYQGWEDVPRALDHLHTTAGASSSRPRVAWLLATAADPAPAITLARDLRIDAGNVHVRPLIGEAHRAALHAAADVVAVPRRTPGGLPVKLLDALARASVVAAPPRALAGLRPPAGTVHVAARDDGPPALAAVIADAIDEPEEARAHRGARGRRWLAALTK